MRQTNDFLLAVSLSVAAAVILPLAAGADAISPSIKDTGKKYSKEKPDTTYYGTGVGARYMEASTLRFEIDRLLQDAEWDKAIVKAKKACQLDPADPDTHMMLARALTHKLQSKSGAIDQKLLADCMYEWKMIWLHDADNLDQMEGKGNYLKLAKIAKGLEKEHKLEMKERLRAKQALAQQRLEDAEKTEAAKTADDKDTQHDKTSVNTPNTQSKKTSIAAKPAAASTTDKDHAAKKSLAAKTDDDSTDTTSDNADKEQAAPKHKRFLFF